MAKHYIYMSSSYTDGTRIAFDITDPELLKSEELKKILHKIKSICGQDAPLSTHFLETESADWDSVVKYDPFFEGVVCIPSLEVFAEKIKKDRVLSGLDVATYILSKVQCTHLALEKLVYLAYADYLCKYGSRLFEDKIYAFTYGPVTDSVYRVYRGSGYDQVKPVDEKVLPARQEMPSRSRILFASDGVKKLQSIDQTLRVYGSLTPRELVDVTHRQGSPWSMVDSSKHFQIIPDEIIAAHHAAEQQI